MKTAKEMFEDLGYEIQENDSLVIQYKCYMTENCRRYFTFLKLEKRYILFEIEKLEEPSVFKKTFVLNINIPFKLHKAISKQIEELGWLDENN